MGRAFLFALSSNVLLTSVFDTTNEKEYEMKYKLLVFSLRLVVLVAKCCGFHGHVLADAEGDAGYGKLNAHAGRGVGQ